MTHHGGEYCSLLFNIVSTLSGSQTLEGLFELTRHPSRALNLPRVSLSELQRNKDTVMCAALRAEVPGHCQQQLTQTLIMRRTFFTLILDFEKSTE